MLSLTRRVGEKVIIDGEIEITIKEIRGSQVNLHFEAPFHISINREEIQKRIDSDIKFGIVHEKKHR